MGNYIWAKKCVDWSWVLYSLEIRYGENCLFFFFLYKICTFCESTRYLQIVAKLVKYLLWLFAAFHNEYLQCAKISIVWYCIWPLIG